MTNPEAERLLSRAIAHHRAGRVGDAVPLYLEALRINPRLTEAHSHLGSAYSALGRPEEAERCHRRVVRLAPRDPYGHVNLGRALQRMGRTAEALEQFAIAYVEAPDEHHSRALLVGALTRQAEFRVGPELRRALDALAGDEAVRHQRLVPAAAGLLARQPLVAKALRRISERGGLTRRDLGPEVTQPLGAPLVLRLLGDFVFSDAGMEALLTSSRLVWLEAVTEGGTMSWPPDSLLAAIALQALTAEWVYAETPEESARLARLEASLAEPGARRTGDSPSRALLVYALYRPLGPFAEDAALVAMARDRESPWAELLRRHLVDPARERSLAAALPRLSPVEDEVSVRVQAQYEERPYPRWRTIRSLRPRPLGDVLAATIEDPDLARTVSAPSPRVLVAGCGTGRHAIATATRFEGAEVLAVDLSLTSLGFAARQAEDLDIRNITFAQADILGLEGIPERFDVVECSGVLHHLDSPETGWAVLRGLLAPGGFMRIGLYSERGRAVIDSVRSLIRERGLLPTVEGIREVRAAVRALPEDHPARRLAGSPDFYSVSGCRDAFFPAREDRFDLPRIARALKRLGLEFVGFEMPDERIRRLYRDRFPEDPAARDLANWERLESEMPNLFAAMYQFWCRAIA